jgi:hypothetical protein
MTERTTVAARSDLITVLLFMLGVHAPAGHAQIVRGVVRQDPAGDPLQGAAIRLLDASDVVLDEVLSDDDGNFVIGLPSPGSYRLEVTRIGYTPGRSDLFTVGPDDEPTVEIHLSVQPVRLDSLEVVGEPRSPRLEMVGFYRRLQEEVGHFILREEIERRSPRQATDLFYGYPGARVAIVNSLTGEYDIIMRAGATMFLGRVCFPTVVLDGVVVRRGGTANPETGQQRWRVQTDAIELGGWNALVEPADIEAIEVYPSAAGLPVQYAGSRSPCGAILIWTRR